MARVVMIMEPGMSFMMDVGSETMCLACIASRFRISNGQVYNVGHVVKYHMGQ